MAEIKEIGEIDFMDVKVKVYNNPYQEPKTSQCVWRMRNPETCYTGPAFLDQRTGKVSYPEGAVIPDQTDRDREILPIAIITSLPELDDHTVTLIKRYLDSDYKRRNPKLAA